MSERILLVDDDTAFRRVYGGVLRQDGHEVDEADDRPSARERLAAHDYAVVLLDLMLPPDGSAQAGLEMLREVLATWPRAKVVVASGAGDVPLMTTAVRAGAYDFLTKPVDPDVLLIVVQRALTLYGLEGQVDALHASLDRARPVGGMVGSSPPFVAAVEMAVRVAASDLPVLVTGESGTGKELLARAVHAHSLRAEQAFVVVNCGGLPETLLESSLFGHVRGAFTGATRDRPGLFVEADGGTLFLDEVGDMPAALQVKLLRALESGEVLPVGADRPLHVDVRLISATNRDLEALQSSGEFREDLYWRIRGAEVRLPPLRERASDIPLLAEHFLNRAAPLTAEGRPKRLADGAVTSLAAHGWPGNLRELRHEMQRATVMAGGRPTVEIRDLELRSSSSEPSGSSLSDQVEALERRAIEAALATHHGNRTRAAEQLGLSRQGLLNKLARYDLR